MPGGEREGGKPKREGIGEFTKREREGLGVKFNTLRGHYFFIPFHKLEKG